MNKLAMYLRLSLEDKKAIEDGGFTQGESNSIGNQRKQILEYIHHDPELSKYEIMEFSDDGCSGTNMERPGMQKLLKEVKENRLNDTLHHCKGYVPVFKGLYRNGNLSEPDIPIYGHPFYSP